MEGDLPALRCRGTRANASSTSLSPCGAHGPASETPQRPIPLSVPGENPSPLALASRDRGTGPEHLLCCAGSIAGGSCRAKHHPEPALAPAQTVRQARGATPSRTGSDQEFLIRARKKGICLNDVLGLYFPGLTHSLEGKRGV